MVGNQYPNCTSEYEDISTIGGLEVGLLTKETFRLSINFCDLHGDL